MDKIEKCKSLLEKLRATETLESRMDILQELSNEEQFELDTYLCYGERGVEGTVCFPYRNGKYFNQKPTEKAPWIKNRFRDLDNLSIESVQKYEQINMYLNGTVDDMHSPHLLKDADKCVDIEKTDRRK